MTEKVRHMTREDIIENMVEQKRSEQDDLLQDYEDELDTLSDEELARAFADASGDKVKIVPVEDEQQ
jgi:hypothetical protein